MSSVEFMPLEDVVQLILATWLFARTFVPREDALQRGIVCAAAFLGGAMALNVLVAACTPYLTSGVYLLLIVASFVLALGACLGTAYACCSISRWQALFCATMAYVMQNLAAGITTLVSVAYRLLVGVPLEGIGHLIASVAITAIVYALVNAVLIVRLNHDGMSEVVDRGLLLVLGAVVFVNIVFHLANNYLAYREISAGLSLVYGSVHAIICVFILFAEFEMLHAHRLEIEVMAAERMLEERERQYGLSKENIDAINIKCHDIRHQIRHLADGSGISVDADILADIAREVSVYDSSVKTGNDAIDTILTEKGLVCEGEGITLSCIADGTALDFMKPAELYALLGNALDNAIEAVRRVEDPAEREINLSIKRKAGMAVVHIENPFAGELTFEDGLPKTSKADEANHGFGIRSMRMTVERHGGTLSVGAHGSTFYLNMLIPRP